MGFEPYQLILSMVSSSLSACKPTEKVISRSVGEGEEEHSDKCLKILLVTLPPDPYAPEWDILELSYCSTHRKEISQAANSILLPLLKFIIILYSQQFPPIYSQKSYRILGVPGFQCWDFPRFWVFWQILEGFGSRSAGNSWKFGNPVRKSHYSIGGSARSSSIANLIRLSCSSWSGFSFDHRREDRRSNRCDTRLLGHVHLCYKNYIYDLANDYHRDFEDPPPR